MKKSFKKFGLLLFSVFTVTLTFSQPVSYNKVQDELIAFQKQLVPDKRDAILSIELKDTLKSVVVVSGETNLFEAKKQLLAFLDSRRISYIDSIRVLPDNSVGDKIWALASLSVSNLRAKPDDASELVSQVEMGTPLKILDYKNKWYRIETPEHYFGWMDGGELKPMTDLDMRLWQQSKRYIFNQISGIVYDSPNKKGNTVSDLVLGDMFQVETISKGFYKIRIPDGRTGYVQKEYCLSFDEWCTQKPNSKFVTAIAKKMMGFPYLWGGTSSKGIDCSGFVKIVYYSTGIILTRDASQQARYGDSIDYKDLNNLQPGDLIFFGRTAQRITHVGIYLGNGDFIHSSGRVHISSLNPADPKYVATRNLVAARRILNRQGTPGIVRVKDHTWYNPKSGE